LIQPLRSFILFASAALLAIFPVEREALGDCERPNGAGECGAGKQPDSNGCCAPVQKTPSCPLGKIMTQKSGGKCCWPGQSWEGGQCTGVPVCPDGFELDGAANCRLSPCEEGQKRPDAVHCCWPGQTWKASTCSGAPQCPPPLEVEALACISPDRDRDGIPNKSDRCPTEPEDKDGFEDSDGCPDPDNDKDGIADAQDRCPNEPEDKNGFKDTDGCPDAAELAILSETQRKEEEAKEARRKRDEQEAIDRLKREVDEKKSRLKADEERRRAALRQAEEEAKRFLEAAQQPASQPTSADGPKGSPVGFALAIGFGIPLVIGSTVTGILAYSATSDLEKSCPTKRGCNGDKLDSAKTLATAATYTGIAGAGLVTLAILIRPRGYDRVGLRLGPGSALVEGKF